MHSASLPGNALEDHPDGFLQPGVGVGNDELHPTEAAGLQRAEEPGPEGLVLAVADVEAEDLAAPVGGNTERDDDCLGHHPVVHPCFAVGRVEEHIRVAHRRQVPIPERADLMI